jgi:hypothetical protein
VTYEQAFGTVDAPSTGYRHVSPYDQQISKGPSTVAASSCSGNDPRVKSDT